MKTIRCIVFSLLAMFIIVCGEAQEITVVNSTREGVKINGVPFRYPGYRVKLKNTDVVELQPRGALTVLKPGTDKEMYIQKCCETEVRHKRIKNKATIKNLLKVHKHTIYTDPYGSGTVLKGGDELTASMYEYLGGVPIPDTLRKYETSMQNDTADIVVEIANDEKGSYLAVENLGIDMIYVVAYIVDGGDNIIRLDMISLISGQKDGFKENLPDKVKSAFIFYNVDRDSEWSCLKTEGIKCYKMVF